MAAATAAIGAVGGVTNIVSGLSQQRKAQAAIKGFKHQDLKNPYDAITVSTLGTDRLLEQSARNTATAVDVLQSAGARGVIGGTGRVQAQANQVDAQVAANLDEQQKRLDQQRAQVDLQNQQVIEQRNQQTLAGYGQMLNQGRNAFMQGLGQVANAAGAMGQLKGDNSDLVTPRAKATTLDTSGLQRGVQPAWNYNRTPQNLQGVGIQPFNINLFGN